MPTTIKPGDAWIRVQKQGPKAGFASRFLSSKADRHVISNVQLHHRPRPSQISTFTVPLHCPKRQKIGSVPFVLFEDCEGLTKQKKTI